MKFKRTIWLMLLLMTVAVILSSGIPVLAASDPGNYVFDVSEGNVTVAAGSGTNIRVTYGASQITTADFANTQEITITGQSTGRRVTVNIPANTANIIMENLDIEFSSGDSCAFDIINGTVNLTLNGTNILKSQKSRAACNRWKTLTVQGDGFS